MKKGKTSTMRLSIFLILAVSILCMSGCMALPTGIAASTKPLTPGSYTEIGKAEGRAVGVMILGIPLSEPYPMRMATDRALESGGGDALINVTADMTQIQFVVGVVYATTVKGTAVQTK